MENNKEYRYWCTEQDRFVESNHRCEQWCHPTRIERKALEEWVRIGQRTDFEKMILMVGKLNMSSQCVGGDEPYILIWDRKQGIQIRFEFDEDLNFIRVNIE